MSVRMTRIVMNRMVGVLEYELAESTAKETNRESRLEGPNPPRSEIEG
jgi:hypothetical protein